MVASVRSAVPDIEIVRISPVDEGTAERLDSLMQPSLFGTKALVVCSDLESASEEFIEAAKRAVTAADDDIRLVLRHNGQARGRGVVNAAERAGAARLECTPVAAREIPAVLTWYARQCDGLLAGDAAQLVVERLGQDLGVLLSAVAQVVHDSADGRVSAADVAVSLAGQGQESQFTIADLVWAGEAEAALRSFRRLVATQGSTSAPVIMISALSYSLRSLARATASGLDPHDRRVAAQLGIPPWKVAKVVATARRRGARDLGRAAVLMDQAEADVKGGVGDEGALDPEQKVARVESLILALTR